MDFNTSWHNRIINHGIVNIFYLVAYSMGSYFHHYGYSLAINPTIVLLLEPSHAYRDTGCALYVHVQYVCACVYIGHAGAVVTRLYVAR